MNSDKVKKFYEKYYDGFLESTAKTLSPIQYYALDKKISIDNFKDSAIPMPFDNVFIENNFKNIFKNFSGFQIWFENVPSIKRYESWLEYVNQLWIHKNMYDSVREIVSNYFDLDDKQSLGTLCLTLLILKELQSQTRLFSPDIKIHESQRKEMGRFIDFVLQYRLKSEIGVTKIELKHASGMKKPKLLASFEHGDFIFQNILKTIDSLDLLPWMLLRLDFRYSESVSTMNQNPIDVILRKKCLVVLNAFLEPHINRNSNKFFTINQLLGLIKILDYKFIPVKKDDPSFKEKRIKTYNAIEKQFDYELSEPKDPQLKYFFEVVGVL